MILTPVRPIPADELARRICAAHHPYLGTVGAAVPCGAHLQAARNVYGLCTADGTATFVEVVKARNEAGLLTLLVSEGGETPPEIIPVDINEMTDIDGAPESPCLQTLYGDRWAVCMQEFGTEHDHLNTIGKAVAAGDALWLDEHGCVDCRDVTEDPDRLACSNCDRVF